MIYSNEETFTIGGLKVLRESGEDVATVIGAGVTVFEALTGKQRAIGEQDQRQVLCHLEHGFG